MMKFVYDDAIAANYIYYYREMLSYESDVLCVRFVQFTVVHLFRY